MATAREQPRVRVQPLPCARAPEPETWWAAWDVTNLDPAPLELLAVWLPHGRFRCAERPIDPPAQLAAGQSARLVLPVYCDAEPSSEVENAFVILRARWRDTPWRILARLKIVVDAEGVLTNTCELLTVQPVGFAS